MKVVLEANSIFDNTGWGGNQIRMILSGIIFSYCSRHYNLTNLLLSKSDLLNCAQAFIFECNGKDD